MACILLLSSAVRAHDSQVYMKMDVTRERISRILKLREILLSFQTGFNLVNAAAVCAILESLSGLEPSSVITEPRYLKLVTVSSFCPFPDVVFPPLPLSALSSSPFHCALQDVLARPDERETCPYHFNLRLFTVVRKSSCDTIAC